MTSLDEVLIMLGLQADSAIYKIYFGQFECAKLRCEVCNLWIVFKDYDMQYPDLWIVTSLPIHYNRTLLINRSLFYSVSNNIACIRVKYHTEWAPHGLDQAVLLETFK